MGKIGRLQRIEGGAITGYPTRVPQIILVEEPGMADNWRVATSARQLSVPEVRRLRLLWAHGRAGVCHGRTSAGEQHRPRRAAQDSHAAWRSTLSVSPGHALAFRAAHWHRRQFPGEERNGTVPVTTWGPTETFTSLAEPSQSHNPCGAGPRGLCLRSSEPAPLCQGLHLTQRGRASRAFTDRWWTCSRSRACRAVHCRLCMWRRHRRSATWTHCCC